MLVLLAVAVGYLYVRGLVQRDLTGFIAYPIFRFLKMGATDRILTMMNEMPRVTQLLVFPTRLSGDYSPNEINIASGFDASQIPGIFICLGTVLLEFALRARHRVASFGVMWTIVAFLPVSNLVVAAGFVVAERTLFFPSIGLALVAGALAEQIRTYGSMPARRFAVGALSLLLVAGLARSIDRQRVWKNNDTFFNALIKDAPDGYRAHFMYARHVGLKSRLRQMEFEYHRAIRLFPYDAAMTVAVADAYTRAGLCEPAVALFEWTFSVEPEAGDGRYEYVYCLSKLGRRSDVRREALSGLRYVPASDIRLMREAVHQANLALAREKH
jgi:hypothetical protein